MIAGIFVNHCRNTKIFQIGFKPDVEFHRPSARSEVDMNLKLSADIIVDFGFLQIDHWSSPPENSTWACKNLSVIVPKQLV